MKRSIKSVASVLAIVILVTGCQTTGSSSGNSRQKEGAGTAIGAVAGAIVGSLFGKGSGRLVGVALGTIVGGYVGNRIGAHLDEQDAKIMEAKSLEALDNNRDGQSVAWNNPDTGTTGNLKPVSTQYIQRETKIIKYKKVQVTPELELVSGNYVALKGSNVRAGASTNTEKLNFLNTGDMVQAVGKTPDGRWLLVARNNRTIGYVYAPLVDHADNVQVTSTLRTKEQNDAVFGEVSLNDADYETETIIAKTECRVMEYDYTKKDGKSSNDQFTACKTSDGAWELT